MLRIEHVSGNQHAPCHARGAKPKASYLGIPLLLFLCAPALVSVAQGNPQPNSIAIDWGKTIFISKSTATLQVVVNPMLRSGSPIHDGSFEALKDLGADYVRYVPWEPYPKLAVAKLDPPTRRRHPRTLR